METGRLVALKLVNLVERPGIDENMVMCFRLEAERLTKLKGSNNVINLIDYEVGCLHASKEAEGCLYAS